MKSQDKIHKLKQVIELLQNDTITPKEVERFLATVVQVIKDQKDQFQTISNKNLAEIDEAVKYLSNNYKEQLANIEKKATQDFNKEVKAVESKIKDVKKLVDEAIKMKPKDGEKGDDGYTPVLGKDYFTDKDKEVFKKDVVKELDLEKVIDSKIKDFPKMEDFDNLNLKLNEFSSRKIPIGLEVFKDGKNLGRFPSINFKGGDIQASASRIDVDLSKSIEWGEIGGTLTDQTDLTTYVTGLPVSTFTNDAGYLTSYTETQTLQDVTDLGATTTNTITLSPTGNNKALIANGSGTGSAIHITHAGSGTKLEIDSTGAGDMINAGSGAFVVDNNGNTTVNSLTAGSWLNITQSRSFNNTNLTGATNLSDTSDDLFDLGFGLKGKGNLYINSSTPDINTGYLIGDMSPLGFDGDTVIIGVNDFSDLEDQVQANTIHNGDVTGDTAQILSTARISDGSGFQSNLLNTGYAVVSTTGGTKFSVSETASNLTIPLSITNTSTQLSLINNGSVKTDLFTDSSGNLSITTSGGTINLPNAQELALSATSNSNGKITGIGRAEFVNNGFFGVSGTSYISFNTSVGSIFSQPIRVNDDINLAFGNARDYTIGHHSASDTLQIVDGSTLNSNVRMQLDSSGNFVFGGTTASARLHAISTTEQLRLGYDASNYASFTVNSTGNLTIEAPTNGITLVSNSTSTAGGIVFQREPDLATDNRYSVMNTVQAVTTNSPSANASFTAIDFTPRYSGTGTLKTLYGAFYSPLNSGTGTVSNLIGSSYWVRNTSTGTVGAMKSIEIISPSNSGTISGAVSGLHVNNQGLSGVTNSYGLFIASQSGSTNSYGVYVGGGKSYFGDDVGIGTTSPSAKLDVNGTTLFRGNATYQDVRPQIIATSALGYVVTEYSNDANAGQNVFQKARGTEGTPLATNSGDNLGAFSFRGHTGSGFTGSKAFIAGQASETWTPTANGTRISFSTTPNGSTTLTEAMRINNNQSIGIGTTATTPNGRVEIVDASGNQLALSYDSSNRVAHLVDSVGDYFITPTGNTTRITGTAAANGTDPVQLVINDTTESSSWTVGASFAELGFRSQDTSGPGTAGLRAKIAAIRENAFGGNVGLAFYTADNAAIREVARFATDGSVDFTLYGSGTFSGTLAYDLGVDSSGNVIEKNPGEKRVSSETSSATPTINTDNVDAHKITALATNITSFTTNLSGTPTDFQEIKIRILDNGSARTIAWGASFEDAGQPLPTTTVAGKLLTVGFIYNSVTGKWGCVAVANET